ncbi:2-dehydro-3-deoxygalactonokinase [Lelliottia sp.]|uniref:2-dehydro-3-deoxygalactonokinase n=1 Tax=Lelliottia sp. TaxID=1898429 RepID=UPI00388FDA01
MKKYWIAVDWGTTNFRAFLMHEAQQIERVSHPCGLLSVENTRFAATLHALLAPWLNRYGELPVMMAGMVGSQQGWHEVPYSPQPCGAGNLLDRMHSFTTPWGSRAWIVPGVSGTSPFGQPDVMRGEEVQLFGLSQLHPAERHFALLPGTHSKHAEMADGQIIRFSTFMTGEVFSLLGQHSLLGKGLPEQQEDKTAFLLGAKTALRGSPFTHLIFSARTRRLAGEIASAHVHSYLSGLTIGYELLTLPVGQHAWVVGSPSLTERYQLAATLTGLTLTPVNGDDCFIRGLSHLFSLTQGNA